jgi:hypothetical protein
LKWISNGLREFWGKAKVLKLAAGACCKQYCLSDPAYAGERVVLRGQASKQEPQSRILGTAALNFLWLLSLFQDKESNMDLWRAKNEQISFKTKKVTCLLLSLCGFL